MRGAIVVGSNSESSVIPWFDVPPMQVPGFRLYVADCLAIGGATGSLALARRSAVAAGLSVRRAVDGVFLILVCAFLLGHVLDVLLYRSDAMQADWRVILPWRGGYCSLGAAAGIVVAIGMGFRKAGGGIDWRYVDQASPAIILGLGILRIGCFLGHHHAGRLSDFVLAVAYPKGSRHDLGLYEAALALGLFTLACTRIGHRQGEGHKNVARAGLLSWQLVLLYAVGRFLLEFLRGDDIERIGRHSDPRYAGLTLVQYAAVMAAVVSAAFLHPERVHENGQERLSSAREGGRRALRRASITTWERSSLESAPAGKGRPGTRTHSPEET